MEAVRCSLEWREDPPRLTIYFSPEIHQDNLVEIAKILFQTVYNKICCLNAEGLEGENYGHPGGRG
jgi:hypothetical protein